MLLYAQLVILVVLVVLNIWYGIYQGLYEIIWWWDIPTHFLGGVWVGLFVAWFLQIRDAHFTVMRCALGAFAIGLMWEIFEYGFGLGGNPAMLYWVDTTKDLFVDVLGGGIVGYALLLEKRLWQK